MKTNTYIQALGIVANIILLYAQAQSESSMKITSTSFAASGPISRVYTLYDKNISPHIAWDGLPHGTKSIALIIEDPDTPTGKIFTHLIAFNINPTKQVFAEGELNKPAQQQAWVYGTNDMGHQSYGGPRPPDAPPHRYFFKVYALDTVLNLRSGATHADVTQAMQGHILGEAELVGTYQKGT